MLSAPGAWSSWTIICPKTDVYRISVQTTPGGKFDLEADGVSLGPLAVAGAPADYLVKMTEGIHGIRLANREGSVAIQGIAVSAAP